MIEVFGEKLWTPKDVAEMKIASEAQQVALREKKHLGFTRLGSKKIVYNERQLREFLNLQKNDEPEKLAA